MAIVAYIPAFISVTAMPTLTGGLSFSPVIPMRPLMPWMMRS